MTSLCSHRSGLDLLLLAQLLIIQHPRRCCFLAMVLQLTTQQQQGWLSHAAVSLVLMAVASMVQHSQHARQQLPPPAQ